MKDVTKIRDCPTEGTRGLKEGFVIFNSVESNAVIDLIKKDAEMDLQGTKERVISSPGDF